MSARGENTEGQHYHPHEKMRLPQDKFLRPNKESQTKASGGDRGIGCRLGCRSRRRRRSVRATGEGHGGVWVSAQYGDGAIGSVPHAYATIRLGKSRDLVIQGQVLDGHRGGHPTPEGAQTSSTQIPVRAHVWLAAGGGGSLPVGVAGLSHVHLHRAAGCPTAKGLGDLVADPPLRPPVAQSRARRPTQAMAPG